MRHILSVLVENNFGVLSRVTSLFSGRGFNIDTLNVAPTHDPKNSRMTIVVVGDDKVLDQVVKQLNRLVEVIEIRDFQEDEYVDRELILIKVKVNKASRAEIMQMCDIFRAKIVDVQANNMSIEITGDEGKTGKFIALMNNFGVMDIIRTGRVAMPRN
ncbi:MAG: acetolactate synthase small subunit [Verrucomicrobiota bacterium]